MRLAIVLVFYVGGLAGYAGSGALGLGKASTLSASVLDDAIPYDPRFALAYLAYFPLLLWVLWRLSKTPGCVHHLVTAAGVLLVSFAAFLVFPTRVERSSPPAGDGWNAVISWIRGIDAETNALPSLHASLSVLAAVCGARRRLVPHWAAALVCGVVLYSALAVKQHLMVDLGAGILLGCVAAGCDRLWEAGRAAIRSP